MNPCTRNIILIILFVFLFVGVTAWVILPSEKSRTEAKEAKRLRDEKNATSTGTAAKEYYYLAALAAKKAKSSANRASFSAVSAKKAKEETAKKVAKAKEAAIKAKSSAKDAARKAKSSAKDASTSVLKVKKVKKAKVGKVVSRVSGNLDKVKNTNPLSNKTKSKSDNKSKPAIKSIKSSIGDQSSPQLNDSEDEGSEDEGSKDEESEDEGSEDEDEDFYY